jgi:hypothetical protein
MAQMVDEAGNIWEVDAQGNPVRFVSGRSIGPDPVKVRQEQRAEDANNRANNAADRAASAAERANANTATQNALSQNRLQMELAAKGLMLGPNGQIVARPGGPVGGKAPVDPARIGKLNSLIDQINRTQELYSQGPGTTSGVAGLVDYLPTDENVAFDTSGAQLSEKGLSAFRIPGSGTMTDRDAAMFERANMPTASTRDVGIEEQLRGIRSRVDEELSALGLPAANWAGLPQDVSQQTAGQDATPMMAAGNNQQGRDTTRALPNSGGPNFGSSDSNASGFVPYGATMRRENNPEWKGVNEAVKGMIVAGQSPDQIKAYLTQRGISTDALTGVNQAMDYYRRTRKKDFRVNVDDIEVPMSGFEQARNNAPQTNLGTAAATFTNAMGFGVPQALAGDQLQYLRDQNPVAAFAGDVGGIVGATSAIGRTGAQVAGRYAPGLLTSTNRIARATRAVGPDAVYGSIYGGVTEGDPLKGAATATLGSAGGQLIGKGLQKGFQGVTDPAVQYLTQRNIPLTIGQTLGNRGVAGRMVNKMESVPILGDMLARNRMDGLKAFEREAINDVIAPLGGRVTTGGADGLKTAQDAVSQAYTDALSGVVVRPDAQFLADSGAALNAGRAVPKFGEDFNFMVNKEVDPLISAPQLDGRQIQSALQSTGRIRSNFASNPDAMAGYAADAAGDLGDSISGMVSRQAPDVMPAYNRANQAFRGLVPFENARISGLNQEAITPAQLARATTSNTKNFGGRGAAARGDNLTDLMRYGQEVLPPTIPNSGTADRNAGILSMLLPAAVGGGAITLDQFTAAPSYVTAPLMALAALSTKTGQKAAQAALTKRPAAVRKAGGMFGGRKAKKGLAGAVTAPMLIGSE